MIATYIQGREAVPAEDVLAPLAHHLRAAGVPLDGDGAHGAALDVLRLGPGHPERDVPHHLRHTTDTSAALADERRTILCAGEAGVPGRAAQRPLLTSYQEAQVTCTASRTP